MRVANVVMLYPLGWKTSPFMLSKIAFKQPIIDQLAEEAGNDLAALDLLKKRGVKSASELTLRRGITEQLNRPGN